MSNTKRTASTPSIGRFLNWNRPQGPIPWGRFFQAAVGICMATVLSQVAVFFAQLPRPLHQASLVMLATALLVAMFAIRALWLWFRSLTVRSVSIFAIMFYTITVLVMAIATTGEAGFAKAIFRASIQVPLAMAQWSSRSFAAILRYPSDFSYAYGGRNSEVSTDAVTANGSTSMSVRIPSSTASVEDSVTTGMLVTLNAQARGACQLDAMTDESFLMTKGAIVTEGPRYEEGMAWWRIRSETGSAWCPANALNKP